MTFVVQASKLFSSTCCRCNIFHREPQPAEGCPRRDRYLPTITTGFPAHLTSRSGCYLPVILNARPTTGRGKRIWDKVIVEDHSRSPPTACCWRIRATDCQSDPAQGSVRWRAIRPGHLRTRAFHRVPVLNTQKAPPDNVKVRQALNYAVPYDDRERRDERVCQETDYVPSICRVTSRYHYRAFHSGFG